jgi:putative inorganic carbon (hco3(-)) transporter
MRDLGLIGFLFGLIALGFRRPFLFVLAYSYVDIVSPQRLSWYLLNSLPVSLICFVLLFLGWFLADDKQGAQVRGRQWLILLLLGYAGYTTFHADFPVSAMGKWDWVWKALLFAFFLPLTLRTKLRIEALLLFMVLSAGTIIIIGGIKTVLSGGGYGYLALPVMDNSGLYESSTLSAVSIAIIPTILYLMKYGTIYPADWRVKLFGVALIFACLMITVGSHARTGLVCMALLAILMLRSTRRRILYIAMMSIGVAVAVPMLPKSYTERMETIKGYQEDTSASTRIAVWQWTWEYVQDRPLGGGFDAYLQNKLRYDRVEKEGDGTSTKVELVETTDRARAYHSAYFEMLGEQGFPGLIMWLLMHLISLIRMELLRRRYANAPPDQAWIRPLATALQHGQLIYLAGAVFVGIAFQPFILMLVGVQIGLDCYISRTERARKKPVFAPQLQAAE